MQAQNNPATHVRVLLIFVALSTLLTLRWVLKYSNYGIDFTDEGFYLVSISNPFLYDWSVTQFGFIYHPLYLLLDGNVAQLRAFNVLITFSLAWVLFYVILRSILPNEKFIMTFTLSSGFAVSSLNSFIWWLLTPSYNSLTMQALLLTSIGLILAEKNNSPQSLVGWIVVGFGGCLAFMAKPSTAMLLALGVLAYLCCSKKAYSLKPLISVASASALFFAIAFIINGSIFQFFNRIQIGINFLGYLDNAHISNIFRLDGFHLIRKEKILMVFVGIFSVISMYFLGSKSKSKVFLAVSISLVIFALTAGFSTGIIQKDVGLGGFAPLMVFVVIFIVIVFAFVTKSEQDIFLSKDLNWPLICIFFVMPYFFAFGSGNNYWLMAGLAGSFWIISAIALYAPLARINKNWNALFPVVFTVQLINAVIMQSAMEHPYRQPSLKLNNRDTTVGLGGSNLMLSDGYSNYINAAKKNANLVGVLPRTPVIDLTGQSPMILYAIKAESVGMPWVMGGYSGSSSFFISALSHVSCHKLSSSWILVQQNGTRALDTMLLSSFGASISSDYKKAASWKVASGAGGDEVGGLQILYKPIHEARVFETCITIDRKP